jgi:hypothetical protein
MKQSQQTHHSDSLIYSIDIVAHYDQSGLKSQNSANGETAAHHGTDMLLQRGQM